MISVNYKVNYKSFIENFCWKVKYFWGRFVDVNIKCSRYIFYDLYCIMNKYDSYRSFALYVVNHYEVNLCVNLKPKNTKSLNVTN